MKNAAGYLLILTLLASITGCVKTDIASSSIAPPGTATGSIIGKLFPYVGESRVIAIPVNGRDSAVAKPDSSGAFRISGLPAGDYRMSFMVDARYRSPDSIRAAVVAGKEYDLGSIILRQKDSANQGSVSGKVTPAKAALRVQLTDMDNNLKYSEVPDSAGNFLIKNVSPGYYKFGCVSATGYIAPVLRSFTVYPGQNMSVGNVSYIITPSTNKSIDTIPGDLNLSSVQQATDFINRAKEDSVIVITGSFILGNLALSPDLSAALEKIIVVKKILSIILTDLTSVTFKSLYEVGQLYISTNSKLSSVKLSALKTAGGLSFRSCPMLRDLDLSALRAFSGDLQVYETGLKDLTAFKNAGYKPLNMLISTNAQLVSLQGLNFTSDSLFRCTISFNPLLTSLDGLQGLKKLKGEILITGNSALQSLTGLENILIAKRLTLTNNAKLKEICPAKPMLIMLKNAPSYQETYFDLFQNRKTITVQPLGAISNGVYATRADLIIGLEKCP